MLVVSTGVTLHGKLVPVAVVVQPTPAPKLPWQLAKVAAVIVRHRTTGNVPAKRRGRTRRPRTRRIDKENPRLPESIRPSVVPTGSTTRRRGHRRQHKRTQRHHSAQEQHALLRNHLQHLKTLLMKFRHTPGSNAAPATPTYQRRATRPPKQPACPPARDQRQDRHTTNSSFRHPLPGHTAPPAPTRSIPNPAHAGSAPTRSVVLPSPNRVNDHTPARMAEPAVSVKPKPLNPTQAIPTRSPPPARAGSPSRARSRSTASTLDRSPRPVARPWCAPCPRQG